MQFFKKQTFEKEIDFISHQFEFQQVFQLLESYKVTYFANVFEETHQFILVKMLEVDNFVVW